HAETLRELGGDWGDLEACAAVRTRPVGHDGLRIPLGPAPPAVPSGRAPRRVAPGALWPARGWRGFFWPLPNPLLGLLPGGLTSQAPRAHGGAIVFDRVPRGLTRL